MVVASVTILATNPATGKEAPAPTPDTQEVAARIHYERAARLYDAGNLAAAIVELHRAHELRPSPRILLTIAEIAEELHDYATALRAYEQFLKDHYDSVDRKRALERVAELTTLVAFLRFQTTPPDAHVTVDGNPVPATTTEPWLINVGRHQVLIEKSGYLSHREVVSATAGETITLRVSLTKVPEPEASSSPTPASPVVSLENEPREDLTPLAWSGFAAAGGLLAAGTVTGILALRADDRARNTTFAGSSPPASIQQDLDKANSLALATDVLVGAALGVTLVTAYFTWWAPSEEDGVPTASTRLRVGPTGAIVEGLF